MRITAIVAGTLFVAGCAHQTGTPARLSPAEEAAAAAAAAEPRELLPDEQVQHVLNRLAFGGRPGDAEEVRKLGVDRWIDLQLHPERIDDAKLDRLLSTMSAVSANTPGLISSFDALQRARRRIQRAARAQTDSLVRRDARRQVLAEDPSLAVAARTQQRLVGSLQAASLARAVGSERQLDEVMVDFWENHFSVFAGKGLTRLFLADYDRDVIRPHALGKFRDLLGAVAKSPAMLFFLDNWQSAADSTHPTLASFRRPGAVARRGARGPVRRQGAQRPPRRGLNENYARELMELHTLGVDGGYTQADVINVARALTGWTFKRQTGEFMFVPALHDAGGKVVLGHKLPAGRGIEDGEDVLDILARAPATAHFITTKLARHFVSDVPPKALVDRCADTFQRTDGNIRSTLRCIVTSPEFFSRAAYRAKVKTPFEVVASALRAVGAEPDTTPRAAQIVARLGQPIYGRQTPDGWPDRGDAWMNTGAILNRINFGLMLAGGRVPDARLNDWPELPRLRAEPRAEQVDGVVRSILGGSVSPETRQVLMSGDNPMRTQKGTSLQGVPEIVGLALGAPEFQRR